MKKRILSILLTACLLVGLLPTVAMAAETAHTHCICGGNTNVGNHTTHTNVTYQPWDGTSDIDYGDDNTAYVYLTNNVTITSNLDITGGKTLYLCLNGKTFASNGSKKIQVKGDSRFILCDCQGGGTIDGADSSWGGAGVYLYNSTMDMYGGKITGGFANKSGGGGGAIALDDENCVFNMYGGEISGNETYGNGGAIFLNGTMKSEKSGTVNIYGGTIKDNTASQNGGAIYAVYCGSVNIYGGTISNNKANYYGGAISLNFSGQMTMSGGTITGNEALKNGGAISLYNSTFNFSGGEISGNKASDSGGAINLNYYSKMTMTGGTISNNTAVKNGGAVVLPHENATLTISDGTITGNQAVDGGAVYLDGDPIYEDQDLSTLNIGGGEISGNKASGSGGAVYMLREHSTFNLSGGTIKNNTAGVSGGAVYVKDGSLNLGSSPVVKGNTVSGKANNVFLPSGKTLSIAGTMTNVASVGITTESTDYPVVFSNWYAKNYAHCFFADDVNAHVNYNTKLKLELAAGSAHTHNWTVAWSRNETHHWHECIAIDCYVTDNAEKDGYAEHTYDQEIATDEYKASDATCTAKATYYKSCVCGAKGTETFESGETSSHTFGAWINEVPATCKSTGTKGHKDCTGCHKHFDANGNEITDLTILVDPDNHEGKPGDWQTDSSKHWKEYSCCGAKVEEGAHVYADDADTTCDTCNYTRTITPSHTHSWATEWSKDETHHWHECTGEGTCDVTNNAEKGGYAEHTYDREVVSAEYKATDATCTAKATYYKSCICGAKGTETFESGETSSHTFGAWINEVPATCKSTGTKGHKDCTGCNKHFDADGNEITDLTISIDPSNHEGEPGDWQTDSSKHWKVYSCCGVVVDEGEHTASDWITDTPETETTDGTKHKECTVCHKVLETGTIPATGYTITFDANGGTASADSAQTDKNGRLETLPIATRTGYIFTGWYDAKIGGNKVTTSYQFTADTTVYAHWTHIGGSGVSTYAITVESAKHGDVTSTHKTAAKGTTVTLTVEPDKGYTLETLTVTDRSGNEIELTNKGDGKYTFKMPGSEVTVTATFMEDNSMLNFFVDVFPGDYYYDAVLWAAENGITTGTDDTHFSPDGTCTRAQAVTFLWRAAGSPAPKTHTMPFTDVKADSYYYDAVLWAVENGITKGTSDTTFSPDLNCSRAQIVTFLWRSEKSPAAGSSNPFTDVAADAYYIDAVLWAVENGITVGTSDTTFSPASDCTRAQIVTFLWRAMTE